MNSNLIYDVGMHHGENVGYYLHKGFKVIAVEANPQLVEQARNRYRQQIDEGRLTIVNAGVNDTEGERPFWVSDCSIWSSFDRENAVRMGTPAHSVSVPCVRFGKILEQYGIPYYLKIDIEGSDHLCLGDLRPADLPHYLSIEASNVDLLQTLRQLGYVRFKCISQYSFTPVELPPSSRELRLKRVEHLLYTRNVLIRLLRGLGMKAVLLRQLCGPFTLDGWTFPIGSSGPFGEQLPGRWLDYDEMCATYTTMQEREAAGKRSLFWTSVPRSFWTDFHASK